VEASCACNEQGLIYRGRKYLVNWGVRFGIGGERLSRWKMKELDGHLWHFRYRSATGPPVMASINLVVATNPPENPAGRHPAWPCTPLGPRSYAGLKSARRSPCRWWAARSPIVADEHVIQPSAPAASKVNTAPGPATTPTTSHRRPPRLPVITVMAKDGTMNAARGPLRPGWIASRRHWLWLAAMEAEGFLVKVGSPSHSGAVFGWKVPRWSRCSTPMVRKAEPLAARCARPFDGRERPLRAQRWQNGLPRLLH